MKPLSRLLRRLFLIALALAVAALLFGEGATLSYGLRAVEYVLKPVFHKKIVNHYCGVYKEDPLLVTAVIKVESKFLSKARSPKGAVGLMQIMPKTAEGIAAELKARSYDLEDPETNIRFGVYYLSQLKREFGGDLVAVLAAYNAGGKNVRDWMKAGRAPALKPADIEFYETKNFVQDVLTTYGWLKKIQSWRKRILRLNA